MVKKIIVIEILLLIAIESSSLMLTSHYKNFLTV